MLMVTWVSRQSSQTRPAAVMTTVKQACVGTLILCLQFVLYPFLFWQTENYSNQTKKNVSSRPLGETFLLIFLFIFLLIIFPFAKKAKFLFYFIYSFPLMLPQQTCLLELEIFSFYDLFVVVSFHLLSEMALI